MTDANSKGAFSAARVKEGEIREFIGQHNAASSRIRITFRKDCAFDTTFLLEMIRRGGIKVSGADEGVLLAVSVGKYWGGNPANRTIVVTLTEGFDKEFFIDKMKNRLEKIEFVTETQTALKRVTSLSLADLKARLPGDQFIERCLVANEIGIIGLTDPENRDEAEEILRGLLRDSDPSVRYTAYCCLLAKQYISSDTYREISRFQDQPDNESMLQGAAEAVRELKIQLNSPPE